MKIKSIQFKNFRRFTELTVQDIPGTARLIMLAGPNGCGKSSFLDGLYLWCMQDSHSLWDKDYHGKKNGLPFHHSFPNNVELEFHDRSPGNSEEKKKTIYARTEYRNDPAFNVRGIQKSGKKIDEINFNRMIDNDTAVKKNYIRLAGGALKDVFQPTDKSVTIGQFLEQKIGLIRDSFHKLFPDLEFNNLGNPMEDGTFFFTKGRSKNFAFKNLSSGEKAVFDLILDLIIALHEYDNTIFCIDEPEAHINARLHGELLTVLYGLVPDNCQLVLATHSIGMMRQARDIEMDNLGRVVFLDFGDRDFDSPQVIKPTKPGRTFWRRAYEIAFDDLAALIVPERIVICEGQLITRNSGKNYAHDARCYQKIFEDEFPETHFISMGNDQEIINDRYGFARTLRLLAGGIKIVQLIDGDARSDRERHDLGKQGVRTLSRCNLETYLFDDEILKMLATERGKKESVQELLDRKKEILACASAKHPANLKPASGKIYNACKQILNLHKCGNDTETFMRDTLAPLVKPDMQVYKELRRDIFGSSK